MATIKSHTDLEQSKVLTKILPLESADMYWYLATKGNHKAIFNEGYNEYGDFELPCWSLAALLGVLTMITKGKDTANPFIAKTPDNEYYVVYATSTKEVDGSGIYDNPVDACYEMIIRLHELNLL